MTWIYHITHIRNLDVILRAGGLWSPNHRPEECQTGVSIAHANIQSRRARRPVPLPPGGVLHDYVPFYLGVRSPMLYANHRGLVPSNPDGQDGVIYLVSTIQKALESGLSWLLTDGHAEVGITEFYDDLGDLAALDWPTIETRSWGDTSEDPDRKRRKQAEFLVHRFFPLALVTGVAVRDEQVMSRVQAALAGAGINLGVALRPLWYY